MASPEYFPKGGMCGTCSKRNDDCSALKFREMRVVKTYADGSKAVRCTEHKRDDLK